MDQFDSIAFNYTNESTLSFLEKHIPKTMRIPDPLPMAAIGAFIIFYVIIILLACFGNVLVIIILTRNSKRKKNATDQFLMSLAIGDLTIALLNMPFQLYYHVNNKWTMGLHMCRFVNYIQSVTITSSITTLTAISVDRYFAICHPVGCRRANYRQKINVIIVGIWLFSFLISTPYIPVYDLYPQIEFRGNLTLIAHSCVENWQSREQNYIFSSIWYVYIYLLPTLIMLITYAAIAHKLWIRKVSTGAGDSSERRQRQKQSVVKMLVTVVSLFTICWFPFFTVHICFVFTNVSSDFKDELRMIQAALQLIGYSNCMMNPICYTFLNPNFKSQFQYLLCQACGRKRKQNGDRPGGLLPSSMSTSMNA